MSGYLSEEAKERLREAVAFMRRIADDIESDASGLVHEYCLKHKWEGRASGWRAAARHIETHFDLEEHE